MTFLLVIITSAFIQQIFHVWLSRSDFIQQYLLKCQHEDFSFTGVDAGTQGLTQGHSRGLWFSVQCFLVPSTLNEAG